jgi:hypothetical protein
MKPLRDIITEIIGMDGIVADRIDFGHVKLLSEPLFLIVGKTVNLRINQFSISIVHCAEIVNGVFFLLNRLS